MQSVRLYYPLDKALRQIRLVSIEPSAFDWQTLRFKLVTVSLNDKFDFAALSYVWGDPTVTQDVFINGIRKSITTNLAAFIKEFRRRKGKWQYHEKRREPLLYLWADAVCINQCDVEEKNHQIAVMHEIYAAATCVISWIHTPHDYPRKDVKRTFWVLDRLYSSNNLVGNQTDSRERTVDSLFDWMKHRSLSGKTYFSEPDPTTNKAWNSVIRFCHHPYFWRLWVLQEMAFAKRLIFWGENHASLHRYELKYFLKWLEAVQAFTDWPSWLSVHLWVVLKMRDLTDLVRKWYSAMKLFDPKGSPRYSAEALFRLAVAGGSRFETSEPRDHIFAFSALPKSMPVDYAMSVRELYCNFHRQFRFSDKNELSFLRISGISSRTGNTHDLPSWAPDYSSPTHLWYGALSARTYYAHRGLSNSSRIDDHGYLKALGCRCDDIVRVESVMAWHSLEMLSFVHHYAWSTDSKADAHPTNLSRAEILVRSLGLDYKLHDSQRLDMTQKEDQALVLLYLDQAVSWFDSSGNVEGSNLNLFSERIALRSSTPEDSILRSIVPSRLVLKEWQNEEFASNMMATTFQSMNFLDWQSLIHRGRSWNFFHTRRGYLGLGPVGLRPGDNVCVFGGFNMPVVLRQKESYWEHVASCFVLGFMDGEAAEQISEGKIFEEEFEIR